MSERFPALTYGTLVAVLAGWKGVQRYRDTRGSTPCSNAQWLVDIFIRQVIPVGRMIGRVMLRGPFRDSLIYYVLLALIELSVSMLW